jgi:hypothetical protein
MAMAAVAARVVEAVMVRVAGGKVVAAAKMEVEEEMTRGTRRQGSEQGVNKANRSRSLPPGTAS